MNVLFIGNSYTYYNDLDRLFEALCRENHKDVTTFRVTSGGRKMIQYKDPADPMTQQLLSTLQEQTFDVVFLQEQSLLPAIDYDAFLEGMRYVSGLLLAKKPRLILYATWARKSGSEDLQTYGWTPEEMTQLLHCAYRKVATEIHATVSPVGLRFQTVTEAAPDIDLHNADMTHPSYAGSCLAALTHYKTLFGAYPENTASLSLSKKELDAFKVAVCQ